MLFIPMESRISLYFQQENEAEETKKSRYRYSIISSIGCRAHSMKQNNRTSLMLAFWLMGTMESMNLSFFLKKFPTKLCLLKSDFFELLAHKVSLVSRRCV